MLKLYPSAVLFVSLSVFAQFPAQADQLGALSWNCWVEGGEPVALSCVHERPQPLPAGMPDTDAELESALMNQLSSHKKQGGSIRPGGPDWQEVDLQHKGAEWVINIRSMSAGLLQDGGGLEGVMSAVLCTGDVPCRTRIMERAHQP